MAREWPPTPRVAIVGGGYSGAVCAVRLARLAPTPVDIEIFEPRPMLGGGVAYSSTDPAHRINVPASRMTVFMDDPLHFERWLNQSGALDEDPDALWPDGHLYPYRISFGRYIASLIDDASRDHPNVSIRHIADRVISIAHHGTGYRLMSATGKATHADLVVLAMSHPPPVVPRLLEPFAGNDARIIADPWADGALDRISPDAEVLIIGTGLTMADVVASLDRIGHHGRLTAFSRRGQASRGHPKAPHAAIERFGAEPPPPTARRLVTAVRQAIEDAAAEGLPWQAVFDDLRNNAQRLWRALPTPERQRFLRHLRSHWDARRYRVAPQVEAVVQRRLTEESLEILAASLKEVHREGDRLRVALHPRGTLAAARQTVTIDTIVVTTGPGHASIVDLNPALAALSETGLVEADSLGLGLNVDATSHAIGVDGTPNPTLLVAGPLARATFGELMGLPQVSEHAALVAHQVAGWLATRGATLGQ